MGCCGKKAIRGVRETIVDLEESMSFKKYSFG